MLVDFGDQLTLSVVLDYDEMFSGEFMRLVTRLGVNMDGVCKVSVIFERDPLTWDRLQCKLLHTQGNASDGDLQSEFFETGKES